VKLHYTGTADIREMSSADFKSLGVEHGKVEWNAGNDFTAEVSSEAAKALMEADESFEKSD